MTINVENVTRKLKYGKDIEDKEKKDKQSNYNDEEEYVLIYSEHKLKKQSQVKHSKLIMVKYYFAVYKSTKII